jgi:transcription elongation factor GreA
LSERVVNHKKICIFAYLLQWQTETTRNGVVVFAFLNLERKMSVSYYSEAGLKKLQDELSQLKNIERPKISRQIAEARDKGDLSENAEYDAAKDAQGMLELRIAKLEEIVANARIMDESKLDTSKALMLSKVKIRNKTNGAVMTYTLVAESEADLKAGKISISSPIGKGLLGKKVGEVAEVVAPSGKMQFEIVAISR